MNEDRIKTKQQLAENIAYYRKKLKLTQLELAEKLNYSDKSVSKWERAEGIPDVFVLKELSVFFGVTVDALLSKRKVHLALFHHKYTLAYFYASIVWLIAGVTFGVLLTMQTNFEPWHIFIYAVPLSALVLLIFYIVWKQIWWIYLYLTIFIWSLALSLQLIIDHLTSGWMFITAIPVYIFLIFLFHVIYKPKFKNLKN